MSIVTTGVQLTKRGFLVIMILFFSFFSWYFSFALSVLWHIVGSSVETLLMVNASFSFIIAVTSVLSIFFINRFSKIHVVYAYSVTTSIASILLLLTSNTILRLIIVFAAGAMFGVGQLAFFTYFWSITASAERGRVSGLAGFFALPFAYVISLMLGTSDLFCTVMLGVILSLVTLTIKLLNPENKPIMTAMKDEEESYPEKRTILLYSVPWALFSLTNAILARNISLYVSQIVPSSFYISLSVLQITAAIFGALVGGAIADFFGRRLSLVFGLTLYGIGSALIGLVENHQMFYFIYAVNGFSWGIFLIVYLLVVWGDLAKEESCAKRYSIGLTIYYLSTGIGSLLADQTSQISLVVSSLVSCLLIFLSNIPLILAPELLSHDFREEIKFKLYKNTLRKITRKPPQNQG